MNSDTAARKVGIEARVRLFGLSPADAVQPEAGSVIGRMFLNGDLSANKVQARDMYEAALVYIDVRNAAQRAIDAKPETGAPPPPEIAGNGDHAGFCAQALTKDQGMRDALQRLCETVRSPSPAAAIREFLTMDRHVPHLVGDLRMALNCLHRHFALGEKRASPTAPLTVARTSAKFRVVTQ